jgi:hypothetical protein
MTDAMAATFGLSRHAVTPCRLAQVADIPNSDGSAARDSIE